MHFRILKMIGTSGFLTAVEVYQIRLWPGRRPGPRWGAYSWFKGALLLRGGEGKGKRIGEGEGRGGQGRKVETLPPSISAYASG